MVNLHTNGRLLILETHGWQNYGQHGIFVNTSPKVAQWVVFYINMQWNSLQAFLEKFNKLGSLTRKASE